MTRNRLRHRRSSRLEAHLALGLLLGELLGAVVGVVAAPRNVPIITGSGQSYYGSDSDDSDAEDSEAIVAWPLLGAAAGAVAGAGAVQLYGTLRRLREQRGVPE
jgi:hypothetical protein